jgi:uncharacterized SAM-binding protein YcdF (DUF218 family)
MLLVSILQRQYPEILIKDCPHADAVVVLGGDTPSRFYPGLELALAGKAPLLIVLDGQPASDGRSAGHQLQSVAVSRGMPADKVLVTRIVHSTMDESLAVAAIIQSRQLRKVILVTSAHHMLRASFLFRKAGISLYPFPVNFTKCADPAASSLVPTTAAFGRCKTVFHEMAGLAAAASGLAGSGKN